MQWLAVRAELMDMRIAFLLLMLAAPAALADQCAWIPRGQAEKAIPALKGKNVIEWCEPCGEVKPAKTAAKKASVVTTRPVDDGKLGEVLVNEKPVDLAYLYVEWGSAYRNVASIVGCRATGVSRRLAW